MTTARIKPPARALSNCMKSVMAPHLTLLAQVMRAANSVLRRGLWGSNLLRPLMPTAVSGVQWTCLEVMGLYILHPLLACVLAKPRQL